MSHIPYTSPRSIVREFERNPDPSSVPFNYTTYDTGANRIAATNTLRNLLTLKYGKGASFILTGPGVEQVDGFLMDDLFDQFNTTSVTGQSGGLQNLSSAPNATQLQDAFNAITSQVYVTVLYPEQPRYEYPVYYEYRIAPYSTVDRFEFNSKQIQNLKYLGSKISGTAINVDSVETSDGGPVVKVSKVNQNQIVFSNNNITTAQANVSGLPIRQLTARTGTSAGSTNLGTGQTTNSPSGGGTSELE